MPNISRGQLAVKWFETRNERKKEARQGPALMGRTVSARSQIIWTPDADTALRLMWPDTKRLDIAARLGCSPQTMQLRADFLGLPKIKTCPTKAEREAKAGVSNV